jgi:uncharacterized damage-inducible protein DinB
MNEALSGLTPQQALWLDSTESHSIWQIVNHLIFWNDRWLHRFKGDNLPKMEETNEETFVVKNGNIEQWQISIKKLDEILDEWEKELTNADETKLNNEAFNDYEDSWYDVIMQITIHNAYHIGQIVNLRKMQGSWKAEQGVK